MKKKINILMIFSGLLFIVISLGIGFLNDFSGEQGVLMLAIGVGLVAVGIAFTPKIWESIYTVVDIITMFFNGLK